MRYGMLVMLLLCPVVYFIGERSLPWGLAVGLAVALLSAAVSCYVVWRKNPPVKSDPVALNRARFAAASRQGTYFNGLAAQMRKARP